MKLSRVYRQLPKLALPVAAGVLLLISFFSSPFFRFKPSVAQEQRQLQHYVQRNQQDASATLVDTALLRKLATHSETPAEFDRICKKGYGLFLYAARDSGGYDLLFWNNQKMIPPGVDSGRNDGVYFQQLLNGYYVVRKQSLPVVIEGRTLTAYILLPILNKYYLETASSPTEFAHSRTALNVITLAEQVTSYPIRSLNNEPLFYITAANAGLSPVADVVTVALRISALLLLLVYLHLLVEAVRRQRGAPTALALLIAILVLCRLALYYMPTLFSLRQLTLFDPTVYAADSINRSLGDLLLNAGFVCWIVIYTWRLFGRSTGQPALLRGWTGIAIGTVAVLALILSTFGLAGVVHTLVTNSKISFDVTNFFSLDVYSVFGFIAMALLSLTYYYFTRLLFQLIRLCFPNLLIIYFAIAVVGLLYLSLRSGGTLVLFQLPVLVWLLLYTLLLSREGLIINRFRMTVAGFLFWIFVFSASLALLVVQGNAEKEWGERRAVAEKYNQLSDPTKERTLRVALAFLNNDFLRGNFSRFYREPENSVLRDSFINVNLLGYANSYSTNFYVFDAANREVNNADRRTYEELENILDVQSKPTGIPDLFYYETAYDQFIYITKREVFDSTARLGSLFIVAAPKHFETADQLYPELFRQADKVESSAYAYAIYRNGKLTNYSSRYPFSTQLSAAEAPADEITRRAVPEYDELWYKAGGGKFVVIARKKDSFIAGITLFSYLFCAFLAMVGLLRLAEFIARVAADRRMANVFERLNIRTQIHGTIIFISVLSFLIIGVATISFFIARYNRNNVDSLSRTAAGAVREMEQRVKEQALLANNEINYADSSAQNLRAVIRDIADVHGVIVNIYDLAGNLRVTSDEIIYRKGILSTKMHPAAFYQLNTLKSVQQVQRETVNQLDYLSIYTAVRNEAGDTYAYLNIPSFTSQLELNQEISNFLVTIINLNAFIFLIAGVVALFITNRITRLFAIVGSRMREITLGGTNEEIVWRRNDEIGELVKQYNKMVHQLEASANALARSEREGAWREMAKQVAHEIKNPLTPMKLSIQFLQKAIDGGHANVQQLTSSVAGTLIEQIDHLSKIAADFAQFANISNQKRERVDLHSVLSSLVELFSADPAIQLRWHQLPQAVYIMADRTQMNRLFTNLLTNAAEACEDGEVCVVTIREELQGQEIIISVSDNGEGIAEGMRPKIFVPNFTTKSSGTGLGLAMCKNIVENSGGSIWFTTKESEGTTFFVQLPLDGDSRDL